ncbi:hypothetical protein OG245_00525 [Streptomyces sp. NBC_01116]|uniref:hypothetical protein n=1 Tax=Streptomyces sp. NBC_01116 TaxID=2903752 RepID=UPI00324819B6
MRTDHGNEAAAAGAFERGELGAADNEFGDQAAPALDESAAELTVALLASGSDTS